MKFGGFMTNIDENRPDVESIIKQIRDDAEKTSQPLPQEIAESAANDSDFGQMLAETNHLFALGQKPPSGIKGILHKIALRVLAPQIAEMNRFNSLTIRLFNKLNQMLVGNDTMSESDLLAQTRRRIDLLTELGIRLDNFEQLDIDSRLKRIEAQLAQTTSQEHA
jgi:hypothetical protein